jgi:hypothetical protein
MNCYRDPKSLRVVDVVDAIHRQRFGHGLDECPILLSADLALTRDSRRLWLTVRRPFEQLPTAADLVRLGLPVNPSMRSNRLCEYGSRSGAAIRPACASRSVIRSTVRIRSSSTSMVTCSRAGKRAAGRGPRSSRHFGTPHERARLGLWFAALASRRARDRARARAAADLESYRVEGVPTRRAEVVSVTVKVLVND